MHAAGEGFGGRGRLTGGSGSGNRNDDDPSKKKFPASSGTGPAKTYGDGSNSRPIRDLIDSEAAMREFFAAREEWMPVFRDISLEACPATDLIGGRSVSPVAAVGDIDTSEDGASPPLAFEFHETSSPWRVLPATPSLEEDREVVAGFLDSMQQSLLDIPVSDSQEDDDNDVQFVEEGRRLLALSRFHVLRKRPLTPQKTSQAATAPATTAPSSSLLESYDALFEMAWSELTYLACAAEEHTGSLILLPDHEMSDVRRFADMNLQRPLEWMGLENHFEVASMHRHSPAIRLLYRLRDVPDTQSGTREDPR
jgi:hypothetical protein